MVTNHPEAQWFKDAKFGVLIRWGTSSVGGIELSWPVQPHSRQHINADEYESLAQAFKAENYDPEEWARISKDRSIKTYR